MISEDDTRDLLKAIMKTVTTLYDINNSKLSFREEIDRHQAIILDSNNVKREESVQKLTNYFIHGVEGDLFPGIFHANGKRMESCSLYSDIHPNTSLKSTMFPETLAPAMQKIIRDAKVIIEEDEMLPEIFYSHGKGIELYQDTLGDWDASPLNLTGEDKRKFLATCIRAKQVFRVVDGDVPLFECESK